MHAGDDAASLVQRLEQALRENPGIPEIHSMLGLALLTAGRSREAEASFNRALVLRSEFAPALDGLGVLLQSLERYEEALAFHERAVASDPRSARAFHNYGNALLYLNRLPGARAAFERAVELDATLAGSYNGLGIAIQKSGDTGDAIPYYRMALQHRPAYADAACNLGNALREVGDLEEAIAWFERAVALEPNNGRFHRYLVDSRPEPIDGAHLRAMEDLARASDTLPTGDRIELHFALGKAYTDTGRFDDAFTHFREGNVLKRSEIVYDERAYAGLLQVARDTFTGPFIESFRGGGNPSDRPIFIVGMPRSGTTLVEQVLAAHPAVRAMGEQDAFELAFAGLPTLDPSAPPSKVRESIRELGDRYVDATDELSHGAQRATDKTLGNFRYVPLIHLALPNARIIDVRRDLLDTCWSCYATLFVNPIPFAFDLAELGRHGRAYERFMDGWAALLPPERFLKVEYERIVEDFQAEARRIVAFCGLPWDDACLAFHSVRRPVRTASHSQVRQPLYRSSIGRAQRFAAHLGPLVEALDAR